MPPSSSTATTTTTTKKKYDKETETKNRRPHIVKVWFIACRPHTLTASLSPLVVGYNASLANISQLYHHDNNNNYNEHKSKLVSLTIQWLIFCMMMQLGCNLHNDYSDFIKGADTHKRVGQARATQKGWLTPNQTLTASCMFLLVGFLLGLNFLRIIMNIDDDDDDYDHTTTATTTATTTTTTTNMGIMIFIIFTSIFNAFAYTGGWPLNYIGLGNFSIGYSGLGDLFVFIYFGLVATLTLPFLYLSSSSTTAYHNLNTTQNDNKNNLGMVLWNILPYAIQVAVLGVNIIVVNNLRDRFTDVTANKRTLAVRFGPTFCRLEYLCNLVIAYSFVAYDWWIRFTEDDGTYNYTRLFRLLPFLSLPLAMKELRCIRTKDGGALNPHVGGAAKVQFLFCILLAISLRMS